MTNDMKQYSDFVESMILTEGDERLVENTLGLVGEAGEVAEKIKKIVRDKNKMDKEALKKELGDVLFYVAALSNIIGDGLQEVADMNVAKLTDRKDRGVVRGSGDDR